MAQVDRFSVSLDTELLAAFDRHIAARGYENRSEAVRDLIRDLLASGRLEDGSILVTGTLAFACDHTTGDVADRLRTCLAETRVLVSGATHHVIDEHREAVTVFLRGRLDQVRAVASRIQGMRGVSHGCLWLLPDKP